MVSDPAAMAHAHGIVETLVNQRRFGVEQPVVEYEGLLAIHLRRLGLFHDQRPMQAAGDLHPGPVMRVVPVGSGIGRHEIIVESLTRRDGLLRQARDTVHRVVDADAVPMDGGRLRQVVDQPPLHPFAPAHPDGRAGRAALIPPDGCRRITVGGKLDRGFARCQDRGRMRGGKHLPTAHHHAQSGGGLSDKGASCQHGQYLLNSVEAGESLAHPLVV